ncbi:MAG TPA: ABC transporter permease [Negativicutes bacterium]|nr:ABC transporter permease [Negativicutes bacterium]
MERTLNFNSARLAPSTRAEDLAGQLQQRENLRSLQRRILSILTPLFLLLIWETLARLSWIDTRFFPMPTKIAAEFWVLGSSGQLLNDVGVSLSRIVVGFLIGALPGLVIGLLMGQSPALRACLNPIIASLYPIPKLAILPLILFIFGLGEASKYVIIAIGVFFIVVVNTMTGSMSVPAIYLDVGREFGASRLTLFRTIVLPAALPMIFAGIKLSWGTALLLMVAAEFVGAKSGIGYLIWNSWQVFSIEQMYVGLTMITFLGFVSLLLLDELEQKVLPWRKYV